MAAESFLLDRMALGEEIGIDFVESLVREFVTVWNEKIEEFKSQVLEISGPMVLAEEDQKIHDGMEHAEIGRVQGQMVHSMESLVAALVPIDVSCYKTSLEHLDMMIRVYGSVCRL